MKRWNAILSFLTIAIVVTTTASQPVNGLVAYYPLDGSTVDISGNAHNGTPYNVSTTTDRFGQAGGAYHFNGISSHIDFGSWFSYPYFTLSFWMKSNSTQVQSATIIDNAHFGNRSFCVEMQQFNQALLGFTASNNSVSAQAQFPDSPNQWHNVVCIKDSTQVSVYVDGSFVSSTAFAGATYYNGTQQLSLGRWVTENSRYWQGDMDEVRFYNRALTSPEIAMLYESINITYPNDGESFHTGIQDTIRWSSVGITGNVRIDLNRNYPSATWETLFANTANNGQTLWTVSGSSTPLARIRIRSVSDTTIADTSNANFRIYTSGGVNSTSLSFNGSSSYVEVIPSSAFSGLAQITIEGWIKKTSSGPLENIITLIDDSDPVNNQTFNFERRSDGTLDFRMWNTTGQPYLTISTAVLPLGVWNHIAAVFNGTQLQIYINGVAETPVTFSGTMRTSGGTLRFGKWWNGDPWWLNANLSSIRIWNTTRTQAQIQQNMYSNLTGTETGLMGYWRLNEGAGTTAYNDVPNGANGTIYGANWSTDVINPNLQLTRPNGGESFYIGTSDTIRWTANLTGTATVKLNRNYPTGAWTILTSITPLSQGYYPWSVSGLATSNLRVAIISNLYPTFVDTSNGNAIVRARALQITHPNGGEHLTLGFPDTIRWNAFGTGWTTLGMSYAGANADSINILSDSIPQGTNFFVWTPNRSTQTGRVYILDNSGIEDWSDNDFVVIEPTLYQSTYTTNFVGTRPHSTDSLMVQIANRSNLAFRYSTLTGASGINLSRRVADTDSLTNTNDTLRIWVRFTPDSTLTYRDTLRITFESPYNPILIPINGLGIGSYATLSASALTFPTVLEPTFRDSLTVRVRVQGNRPLSNATWITIPSGLPFRASPNPLTTTNADDSVSVKIYFEPAAQGTFSGQIALLSTAVNEDTLRLTVTGTSHYVPATPGNLSIVTQGENAVLNWARVDTSTGGVPLTVQRYLIYFRNSNTTPWYFHGITTGANSTTYTHTAVVSYSPAMYYQVTAWVGSGSSSDSFDNFIRDHRGQFITKEEIESLLRGLGTSSSNMRIDSHTH